MCTAECGSGSTCRARTAVATVTARQLTLRRAPQPPAWRPAAALCSGAGGRISSRHISKAVHQPARPANDSRALRQAAAAHARPSPRDGRIQWPCPSTRSPATRSSSACISALRRPGPRPRRSHRLGRQVRDRPAERVTLAALQRDECSPGGPPLFTKFTALRRGLTRVASSPRHASLQEGPVNILELAAGCEAFGCEVIDDDRQPGFKVRRRRLKISLFLSLRRHRRPRSSPAMSPPACSPVEGSQSSMDARSALISDRRAPPSPASLDHSLSGEITCQFDARRLTPLRRLSGGQANVDCHAGRRRSVSGACIGTTSPPLRSRSK